MLVEIDLLDYLAYQMGCGILSDLRLFQQSERLHRLTAAIPLGACSEQEPDSPFFKRLKYFSDSSCGIMPRDSSRSETISLLLLT